MNVSDPIADMLTRIRNASRARHTDVMVPASRTKLAIARILKDEGFIEDFSEVQDGPQAQLRIRLRYVGRVPVVSGLKRISKPGLRVYAAKTDIPRVLGGLGVPVLAISADSGEGLDELRAVIGSLLPDVDGLAEPPDPAGVVIHRIEASGAGFVIEREDLAFRVRGKRIERLTTQTNFEVEESAERFQRELARHGVDAALRKAGIRPGDAVRIAAVELEWEPPEDDR